MIYGYLRASTDKQDINSQKQGVDQFAKEHDFVIEKYISDEGVSGGKDPSKRNLGPVLEALQEGDIIIASEISRLGRDLYMVMDILHHCMKVGCVIYTVKDRFVLGNDIQSKVLAFAFGLSAEIERQMLQQRTREGLRLRMKMGVLLGRPVGAMTSDDVMCDAETKARVVEQYRWGVPERRMAENFGVDRTTITRWLHKWGIKHSQFIEKQDKAKELARLNKYKDGDYDVVELTEEERKQIVGMVMLDMTLPQIADTVKRHSYEQIYDTFMCDRELNELYRKHGQKKIVKKKK